MRIMIVLPAKYRGAMRIIMGIVAVMLAGAIIFCVGTPSALSGGDYAVRVRLALDYRGQHFEKSFLTRMTGRFCWPVSTYCWDPGRRRTTISLPDGSLVLLSPAWPLSFKDFVLGQRYESRASWLWFDNAKSPKQAIAGDGATKISALRSEPAPFTWLSPSATIERVNDTLFSEAKRSDAAHDELDRLQFSNAISGGGFPIRGTIFLGMVIQPIHASGSDDTERVQHLKDEQGWSNATEGCRVKPIYPGNRALLGLTDFRARTGLLLRDGIWDADGGPRPGEPQVIYTTGEQVDFAGPNFDHYSHTKPAYQMIRDLKWNGHSCRGIVMPQMAVPPFAVMIEFSDGTLALLEASIAEAVWKN